MSAAGPPLPPPAAPLAVPASPGELFGAFTWLALQGFGGVLPVAQRELVERRRWLEREQFLALLSMAQVLPGPNIVNLALMIGHRHFGWRGAVAACAGILLAPLVLVLVLAAAAQRLQSFPAIGGALRGMGIVAAGLTLSTAIRLADGMRRNALGVALCAALAVASAAAIGVLHWPLAPVVFGLGLPAVAWAWRTLR